MAIGKSLKKSFYADSEVGQKNIEMPPLPEESQSFINVPTNVPEEVYNEMNDNEMNNDMHDEINESIVEQDSVESDIDEITDTPVVEKKEKNSSAQDSFKAIREAKEKAERERDMLLKQMMDYQRERESLSAPKEPVIDDDIDFLLNEDDIVEGRYVKKVTNKLKNIEKQLQAYQNQNHQNAIEAKIKQQFPDFEQVVSPENVEMLNTQFPEIARTIGETQDLYGKAVSAYNIMKKFGIHRDNPHEEERIRALRNTQKPRTVTSVNPQQGDSPLSKANAFANGLTEDLKEQLRREMLAARKAL